MGLISCVTFVICILSHWLKHYFALSFSADSFENYMKTIKPFNGTDYPIWKEKVQDILKFLGLDYVLNETKPIAPTPGTEDLDEKMYEYHFKLEAWEKSDKLAKKIIKLLISDGIRGAFKDDEDMSAMAFFYMIELSHRKVCVNYLIKRLTTTHYDGQSGFVKHISTMWDIAYELKAFGLTLPDSTVEGFIKESLKDIK